MFSTTSTKKCLRDSSWECFGKEIEKKTKTEGNSVGLVQTQVKYIHNRSNLQYAHNESSATE